MRSGIDGCVRLIAIHRRRHAAHQIGLRVGILATQHGLDANELALQLQRFNVVRHRQQIRFRRQLIRGMSPIAAAEEAQLVAANQRSSPDPAPP